MSKLPGDLHRATDGWAQAETVHNVNYEMLIGLLKWEHSQTAGNREKGKSGLHLKLAQVR